jgi:hypothetical protein
MLEAFATDLIYKKMYCYIAKEEGRLSKRCFCICFYRSQQEARYRSRVL